MRNSNSLYPRSQGRKLFKLRDYNPRIEVIGDNLAVGMYTSYEGLSSWA